MFLHHIGFSTDGILSVGLIAFVSSVIFIVTGSADMQTLS